MRKLFCALQCGIFLVCACATAGSQTASAAQLPYTAHFKSTTVKTLADGSTSTSVLMYVQAADSHSRVSRSYPPSSDSKDRQPRTGFEVHDFVHSTVSHWAEPGETAQVIHMPDLGEPETDCAKVFKDFGPLHPFATQKTPIEDLGIKTFLGIEARGGRISFTATTQITSSQAEPESTAPLRRTNEVWIATDPRLGGLIVYMTSSTSLGTTRTRELTEFTQAEPDPQLFEIPADRQIVKSEANAFGCGPRLQPKSTRIVW